VRKSSNIHRTISRGQRESVAYVVPVPGVVAVVVDGPLKFERESSGECSPGLLAASVISVEPVASEAFCMSGSSLLSGSRMGGRSCLLYSSQNRTINKSIEDHHSPTLWPSCRRWQIKRASQRQMNTSAARSSSTTILTSYFPHSTTVACLDKTEC
jgi:hypothetical protein